MTFKAKEVSLLFLLYGIPICFEKSQMIWMDVVLCNANPALKLKDKCLFKGNIWAFSQCKGKL